MTIDHSLLDERNILKKALLLLALIVGLVASGVFAYRLAMPEIVIANVSHLTIEEVIVQLPSSRVVFGNISPGTDSGIYYSASQADGVYEYSVQFAGEPLHSGSCGYVTSSDYGKRMQLVVLNPGVVECRESNKIF